MDWQKAHKSLVHPGNGCENVMKGDQHKVQDAKRYEGKHAQSSIIHNTVQNIRLPQIG